MTGVPELKILAKIVISLIVITCFILSGVVSGLPAANAYNGASSSKNLLMTVSGGVLSAGNQVYTIEESGQAISASLAGYNINQSKPMQFNYYLFADVEGLSVSGGAFFALTASLEDGRNITIVGYAVLSGEVPAVCFPSYNTSGVCEPGDTSAIPAFFLSIQYSELFITISGPHQQSSSNVEELKIISIPMAFESAYLNPFGAPLVLGSADGFATLLIIAPYNTGTVSWSSVVTAGQINGTYGATTSVSGVLNQVTSEQENLVSGTALDHGIITVSNMVESSNGHPLQALDATGRFHGASIIPKQGGIDCSASIGFPAGSGLCTEYGFLSTGTFKMYGQNSTISGSYSTNWGIPALTFTAVSLARVTTTSQ